MTQSDFVFERGDPIDVGASVENDFVYESGDIVADGDASDFAFIRERGLGPALEGTQGLIFQFDDNNGGSNISGALSDLGNGSGLSWRTTHDGVSSLDSAIQDDDAVVGVMIRHGQTSVSSAEFQAFADHYNDAGNAIVWGEDGGTDGSRLGRQALTNDFAEELVGVRPFTFDEESRTREDGCNTDTSVIPAGPHPVYDSIADGESYFVNSDEALVVDPADPAKDINERATGYVDDSSGRIWLDGSYVRYEDDRGDNPDYPGCSATREHVTNIGKWIVNEL